jgi:hypothetical protein
MIEVEGEHMDRRQAAAIAVNHDGSALEKSAAVQDAGQRVGRSRHFVETHRTVLGQGEHDKAGIDDVEHDLDHKRRNPAASETAEHVAIV